MGRPGSSGDDPVGATRQAIAEALRRVDLLRDPEGRKMCIQFSEEEIGETIFRARGKSADQSDDADLLELADQLLVHDVAMWVFVYTIADIYGPGEIADSVRVAVSLHLAAPVLNREQRRELHQMCANLAGLDVPQLFTLSIDNVGHTLRSDPANLRAVLNELEQLPARAQDKLPPIAVFVDNLASAQPAEFRERLRTWVVDFVGPRMPHAEALGKIRDSQRVPSEAGQRSCAIHLDPDGIDPSLCYMSVYIQEGSDPAEPLLEPDDTPYAEEQIRARIHRALNSPQLARVHPDELRIEFFLPNFLISLPVDQWRVGVATLGVQHPVVVRSMTRLRELAGTHRYWQEKWSRAQQAEFNSATGGPDAGFRAADRVSWLTEQAVEHDPDQVYVALINRDGPVCLVLAQSPAPDHCKALLMALAAGIPVLIWSRSPEVDLRGGLRSLLAEDDAPLLLSDLPLRVLAFRRSAAERDHLSRHLTLLYDDGSRIPGSAGLFRMPT